MKTRSRWMLVGSALVALLGLVAPGVASAVTGASQPASIYFPVYHIVNVHSGMCMSVRDASRQQGAAVTQFPCSDNYYDQYWEIVDSINPPGYKLVVDFNSQQVLSVLNASLALGAPVDQWDYSPNYLDQLWYLPGFYNSDGLGALVNYHSNACLSVPNASQQQDVQLDQWNCDVPTFTDQTWKIIYVRNMAPLPV